MLFHTKISDKTVQVALLAEGVDRNRLTKRPFTQKKVALLAEGVDRNPLQGRVRRNPIQVALLAEGVDRNTKELYMSKAEIVALLAEGVDRNNISGGGQSDDEMSPSSRRAWIEIIAAGE